MPGSMIHTRTEGPKDLSLEERIRRRAHEIWLENGSPMGTELIDWQEAEKEVLREQ